MKTCCDCQETKSFDEFVPKESCKDGYEPRCRRCRAIRYTKADPSRVTRIIYNSQTQNSINRGHPAPAYSLDDLINWMDLQPNMLSIWTAYESSNYNTDLRPSVDRKDDDQPYTLNNIQLMTWADNRQKFATNRKEGRTTVTERAVMAIHPNGMPSKTYHSIMDAVRDVNGRMWGIVSVANGVPVKDGKGQLYTPKSYKGFGWKWI